MLARLKIFYILNNNHGNRNWKIKYLTDKLTSIVFNA